MSEAPKPLVRGALRQTPLAEFLVQAYDGGFEGTLLLQTAQREKSAVLFVRGTPAKARPFSNQVFLGDVAVDLGLISAETSKSTRKRAQELQKTHGEILQSEGHLDDTGVYVALREQLKRQVLRLCDLPDTTGFGFYRTNYLADWGPAGEWRAKPLPLMWRALVDHLPASRRTAWLSRLAETPLKMRPEAPVSRYGMTAQEKGVIDMIRVMPAGVSRLRDSGAGAPELVDRVVVALLLSRQIEVGVEKEPVGINEPAETPNSVPPPATRAARRAATAPRPPNVPSDMALRPESRGPMSGAPSLRAPQARRSSTAPRGVNPKDTLRAQIEAYQANTPKNHYETLGISPEADAATIRSAFFQLARTWHPDRVPEDLKDLKPVVAKAFSAMGEAHQTLSDPAKRAQYDQALAVTPDDEQAQVSAILEAASAFQQAEVLLKKKDFAGALSKAQIAYEGDPTQADHAALYSWLQGMNRSGKDLTDLIEVLDKALEAHADNVRALWYRAQLLKKSGNTVRAIKDLKKIIQLKPNHVDAQRELRVYAMRKRSDPSVTPPTGFFGKFMKKD